MTDSPDAPRPTPLPREPGPASDRATDRLRAAIGRGIHIGLPVDTSRGELARLVTARLRGRGTARELWADARVGPSDAAFRRWLTVRRLAGRPAWLPPSLAFRVVLVGHDAAAATTRESIDLQGHDRVTVVGAAPDPSDIAAAAQTAEPDEWVVFAHAGDRLEPGAFDAIGVAAGRDPGLGLVTWDDAVLTSRGPGSPRIRVAWSPDLLLTAPYLHRAFAIRGELIHAAAEPTEAATDPHWDLLLRSGIEESRTHHIPRVLSVAIDRRDTVGADDVAIVQAELDRRGWPAIAEVAEGRVRLEWRMPWPTVSIVVPSPHNRPLLAKLLADLQATEYPHLEVVAVDNREVADRAEWYDQAAGSLRLRTVWWDEPFNYSAVNNAGASVATGDMLVFLNDDMELPDPRWLKDLVGWASRPEIGPVGAQLVDPEGLVQHGGVVLGLHGFAEHLFRTMTPGTDSLLGPIGWTRNATAVTGACIAIRRELFEAIGGFDERFRLTGSDVALSLDASATGHRVVCTASREVRHLESASRGGHDPLTDVYRAYWRYRSTVLHGDPYYSGNLTQTGGPPRLISRAEPGRAELLARAVHRPNDQPDPQPLASNDDRPLLVVADHDDPHHGSSSLALAAGDRLATQHGVRWRLAVMTPRSELLVGIGIGHHYAGLAGCRVDRWLPDEPVDPGTAPAVVADLVAEQWVPGDNVHRTGPEPWAEPGVWMPHDLRERRAPTGRVLVAPGARHPALAELRRTLPSVTLVAFQPESTSAVLAMGPLIGPEAARAMRGIDAVLLGPETPQGVVRALALTGTPLVATGSFDPGLVVAGSASSAATVAPALADVLADPVSGERAADQAFALAATEADRLKRLVAEIARTLGLDIESA